MTNAKFPPLNLNKTATIKQISNGIVVEQGGTENYHPDFRHLIYNLVERDFSAVDDALNKYMMDGVVIDFAMSAKVVKTDGRPSQADIDAEQSATQQILKQVALECDRQVSLWGVQNYPMISAKVVGMSQRDIAEYYAVPMEKQARKLLEMAQKQGHLSYMHILLEEVCEAVAAKEPVSMREELVQVAAVATSMIAALDRQAEEEAELENELNSLAGEPAVTSNGRPPHIPEPPNKPVG